ncbi:hypothetical protein GN244_ATG02972 [Phytophthora infestans]|uniref:Uncharacterized protein n=1 Tax=Phytophthora infestans TaxID=4787 RepID=A0A833TE49_PHYIN|nr:hypothetical protein GN244_ATG02972 [Phytophthora infestans]
MTPRAAGDKRNTPSGHGSTTLGGGGAPINSASHSASDVSSPNVASPGARLAAKENGKSSATNKSSKRTKSGKRGKNKNKTSTADNPSRSKTYTGEGGALSVQGYSEDDITAFLTIIDEVCPRGSIEWNHVLKL